MPKYSVDPYLHGTPLPRAKPGSLSNAKSAFKAGLSAAGYGDVPFKVSGKVGSSTRKMSDKLKPSK